MTEIPDRVCVGCGDTDEMARLDTCVICLRPFCADCAVRAFGRRFCSMNCAHAYYAGDMDDEDDENAELDDD